MDQPVSTVSTSDEEFAFRKRGPGLFLPNCVHLLLSHLPHVNLPAMPRHAEL